MEQQKLLSYGDTVKFEIDETEPSGEVVKFEIDPKEVIVTLQVEMATIRVSTRRKNAR